MERAAGRTREQILDYVNRHGPTSVDVLATELGVVPVTVRAHTAALEREDLLKGEEVRNGRAGRPRIAFSVTEKARKTFPKSYDLLATRLLDTFAAERGQGELSRLFQRMGREWGDEFSVSLEAKALEERVEKATEVLNREGCEAEWEKRENVIFFRFHNCPYMRVVEEHPELCTLEQTFLQQTLELPVEIRQSGPHVSCCVLTAGPAEKTS